MSDSRELDSRFGNGEMTPATPQRSAGQATMVEQARAIAEVRAAVMIAMDRPRDRTAAIAEMREVCGISALAERAFFRVQRGREKDASGVWTDAFVNGESISLARELARCWGNIDYGVKELARDDIRGQSELLAFAWDLQTNARSEITFIVPHMRGSGEKRKRLVGTQEVYENNASFAGRRLREAIFSVLPVWFKAEAAEICHETLAKGGGKPLVTRIADLRVAFEALGIATAQLERKRGRKIDDFLPEDVAALRVVYGSLKRGEVTIAEEFPAEGEKPAGAAINGDKLAALEQATTTATATAGEVDTADETARDRNPFGLPPLQTEQRASSGEVTERGNSNGGADRFPDHINRDGSGVWRDRDESWWSGDRLFTFTKDRTADLYTVRQRIAEARDLAELGTLQGIHNKQLIEQLSRADQNEIADLVKTRRGELAGRAD